MENTIIFEKNAISKLCDELKSYNKIYIITSPTPKSKFLGIISNLLNERNKTFWTHTLPKNATCSKDNILLATSKVKSANVIVALGAGTVCDISKIVGEKVDLPVFVVPTTITHYGIFNNISYITSPSPEIVRTNYPKKVYIDEGIIEKSPEKFIHSALSFAISLSEQSFSLLVQEKLLSNVKTNLFDLDTKIKKIEELTGWLSLSKSFAVLNLMDYIYDLFVILNDNYITSSICYALMISSSTLKNNFGEKCLLCSKVLLRVFSEFFGQKTIIPKDIPDREKILFLLGKQPVTGNLSSATDYKKVFENYIKTTDNLLSTSIQLSFKQNKLKFQEKCLEKEIFISKFLNKFRLINSDLNEIRMIDENQLFSNLELLPIQFNNLLPRIISRFGFLNVI